MVGPALPAGGLVGVAIGLVVSVGSLAYAWRAGLTPAQLGLGHWRTAPLSLVLGLLVVGLPLLAVRLTTEIGIPLPVPPPPPGLEEVPREALLQRIGLYLPFDTVLLEEFAFRGVLLAVLYRRLRPNGEIALVSLAPTHSGSKKAHRLAMAGAVLGVTLCFVLWHVCLNWSETPGDLLLFLGKLGAYAAGGLAFTLPLISRNLVGCFTAHWLADAVLMLIAHPEGQWLREIVLPQRL